MLCRNFAAQRGAGVPDHIMPMQQRVLPLLHSVPTRQPLRQRPPCCQVPQLGSQALLQEGWGAGWLQEAGGDAVQTQHRLQGRG
jgi:hypothetical protein